MTSIDRFAVIGDPIAHSLSPVMQTAALVDAGIEATYVAERISPHELTSWVVHLRRGEISGCNVTIPHKEAIGACLDRLDAVAAQLGAVNTVVRHEAELVGYNTDVVGFTASVDLLGLDLRGGHAVVFGAGGSARAVVYALAGMGATVTIVNRTRERAERLDALVPGGLAVLAPDAPSLASTVAAANLLVNTTPLGMAGAPDDSPLPDVIALSPNTRVIDLVYGRPTPFLTRAREIGCPTLDGIEMLVQQGAASFHLWTGQQPNREVMRHACRKRLEELEVCFVS